MRDAGPVSARLVPLGEKLAADVANAGGDTREYEFRVSRATYDAAVDEMGGLPRRQMLILTGLPFLPSDDVAQGDMALVPRT